jgi:hypothetical protein
VKKAFDYFLMPNGGDKQKGELSGKYLMMCLPDHLKALYEAEGLDELSLADKQYIGSHVYDLFNEGDLVETNWEICPWSIWYKSDDEMGIFWNWLDDPVAIARLGARDKRWLAEIKKGKNRNRSLLTPIMTMIARNWLQATEWEISRPSDWLTGFLQLVRCIFLPFSSPMYTPPLDRTTDHAFTFCRVLHKPRKRPTPTENQKRRRSSPSRKHPTTARYTSRQTTTS